MYYVVRLRRRRRTYTSIFNSVLLRVIISVRAALLLLRVCHRVSCKSRTNVYCEHVDECTVRNGNLLNDFCRSTFINTRSSIQIILCGVATRVLDIRY